MKHVLRRSGGDWGIRRAGKDGKRERWDSRRNSLRHVYSLQVAPSRVNVLQNRAICKGTIL